MNQEILSLAAELGTLLQQKKLVLATAESCTGGGLSYVITHIPGSSEWFDRSFVTYSNNSKMDMLGVAAPTLDAYGAVSEAVAREMAEGALKHSNAQLSVSITGIAGPGGGTKDKPVGTVWTAYAGRQIPTEAHMELFSGDREAVRTQTIQYALQHLIKLTKAY